MACRDQSTNTTAFFFRQVPQQSRLMILPPPASASVAASSCRSAEALTARDVEQQEEELQTPSVQQARAGSSSNTRRLRPNDELRSLQTFVASTLCGGSLHACDIQLLAQQLLQVHPSTSHRLVSLCGSLSPPVMLRHKCISKGLLQGTRSHHCMHMSG